MLQLPYQLPITNYQLPNVFGGYALSLTTCIINSNEIMQFTMGLNLQLKKPPNPYLHG